jgi:hypothetical protein
MSKKQPKHLVDPTQLKPIDTQDGTLQVIIETPKGSRNNLGLPPGLTQTVKALFAVRRKILDRQDHSNAF